jgi:hypothetical protein
MAEAVVQDETVKQKKQRNTLLGNTTQHKQHNKPPGIVGKQHLALVRMKLVYLFLQLCALGRCQTRVVEETGYRNHKT